MKPSWKAGALIVIALAGAAAYVWFARSTQESQTQRAGRRFAGDAPPTVLIARPRTADVPVMIDAVGTVAALRTVTIRPQVEGRLIEIGFREGAQVKAGDVLARIDPAIYKAQLDSALAKKAQSEAQLANARLDLTRYTKLAADRAASPQQLDTQRALVAQIEAQVRLDTAAIDNARVMLGYTTITSPISGRAGIRQVDEGNIVRSSDVNGLVVITEVDPITVSFAVPQQHLPLVIAAMARGRPRVEIARSEGGAVQDTGTLEVIDNQIDQTTGTVRLKAVFPNGGARLWPGQYVSVRLEADMLKAVTVLPGETIQRGPSGPFVFVLKDEDKVAIQPVKLMREAEGLAIVGGMDMEARVVSSGFARLVEGTKVRIAETSAAPAKEAQPAEQQERRPGEGRRRREGGGGGSTPAGERRQDPR